MYFAVNWYAHRRFFLSNCYGSSTIGMRIDVITSICFHLRVGETDSMHNSHESVDCGSKFYFLLDFGNDTGQSENYYAKIWALLD